MVANTCLNLQEGTVLHFFDIRLSEKKSWKVGKSFFNFRIRPVEDSSEDKDFSHTFMGIIFCENLPSQRNLLQIFREN